MNELQLESLLLLKSNAKRLLEKQDSFDKDRFYTCLELSKPSTTISNVILERLSYEFSKQLSDELGEYYPYSTAFLHTYINREYPDLKDIGAKLKELRIRWLNFIIDYPES